MAGREGAGAGVILLCIAVSFVVIVLLITCPRGQLVIGSHGAAYAYSSKESPAELILVVTTIATAKKAAGREGRQ